MSKYRALTIQQPWLYAIMELGKTVENRSWEPPDYIIGRRIGLHASKTYDKDGFRAIVELCGYTVPPKLPTGCFLATATVAGVVTDEYLYSNVVSGDVLTWYTGPYGWLLTDVRRLEKPVPCAGSLGLWNIPDGCLKFGREHDQPKMD